MARVRSLVRLKRLLDEWRARGETARAMGLTCESVAPPSITGARALVIDDWDLGAQTIQQPFKSRMSCDIRYLTKHRLSFTSTIPMIPWSLAETVLDKWGFDLGVCLHSGGSI